MVTLPKNAITEDLSKAVIAAMTRAAEAEILPRWRALSADEIRTKAHDWDLVTDADLASQQAIRAILKSAFPDDAFVGVASGGVEAACFVGCHV